MRHPLEVREGKAVALQLEEEPGVARLEGAGLGVSRRGRAAVTSGAPDRAVAVAASVVEAAEGRQ